MGAGKRGKEAQPSLSSFDYDSWAACAFTNAFDSQSWESPALSRSHLGPSCYNEGSLCPCMRLHMPQE